MLKKIAVFLCLTLSIISFLFLAPASAFARDVSDGAEEHARTETTERANADARRKNEGSLNAHSVRVANDAARGLIDGATVGGPFGASSGMVLNPLSSCVTGCHGLDINGQGRALNEPAVNRKPRGLHNKD